MCWESKQAVMECRLSYPTDRLSSSMTIKSFASVDCETSPLRIDQPAQTTHASRKRCNHIQCCTLLAFLLGEQRILLDYAHGKPQSSLKNDLSKLHTRPGAQGSNIEAYQAKCVSGDLLYCISPFCCRLCNLNIRKDFGEIEDPQSNSLGSWRASWLDAQMPHLFFLCHPPVCLQMRHWE